LIEVADRLGRDDAPGQQLTERARQGLSDLAAVLGLIEISKLGRPERDVEAGEHLLDRRVLRIL